MSVAYDILIVLIKGSAMISHISRTCNVNHYGTQRHLKVMIGLNYVQKVNEKNEYDHLVEKYKITNNGVEFKDCITNYVEAMANV